MKLLNTAKLENLPQSLENIVFQIVDDMPQAKTELIETVNYTPTRELKMNVYIVDNISPIDTEHDLLFPTKCSYGVEFEAVKANNMIAEHQYNNTLVDMVKALHENFVLIVDKSLRDLVYQAINVAKNIHKAYSSNDIYKNICIGDKVQSILEWWYTAPNANALMEELVSDESLKAVETVFEKVLADIYTTVSDADKLNLMTQEEQIDTFLKFSKDKKANKHARMTDKDLEEFTESNRYQHAIKLLTDNGFRLSDTQQYNVKQSAIFFQKNRENYMAEPLFNLSDMGAGKTLMTVESMFLHDLWCVENNKNLESKGLTANSQQVATELFGEQPDQHQSEIINLPSAMTSDDIVLLKTIYNIAKDYKVYRNRVLATTINNALLNLGDGLADNTIYDILSNAASKNVKFLEYLTSLDIEILEKLPQSQLIAKPNLAETAKFKALTDILAKEKDETHLIVVNDYKAMKTLSQALNIDFMSEKETNDQANYQDILNNMFDKQSIVVVPQHMLKSSIDLVQANRLIQYQLNSDIADIIQTQNRINRIGQTRETKAYYIANDELQENIIELFLETYRNIKVAHKGIVELFVDMNNQVNVVNDYLEKALENM